MSFVITSDFYGRRIDLLGSLLIPADPGGAIISPIVPLTVFTANNSQWPSGGGKTFVVFATINYSGLSVLPTGTVKFRFGLIEWSSNVTITAASNPVTIYAGTGLGAEANPALAPGPMANGTIFTISFVAGVPTVDTTVQAFGWAE